MSVQEVFVLATARRRSPASSNAISSLAPFLRGYSSRSGVMTVLHVIYLDPNDEGENLAAEEVRLVLMPLENPLLPPFSVGLARGRTIPCDVTIRR